MRIMIRTAGKACLLALVLAAPVLAQNQLQPQPVSAAVSSEYSASGFGYNNVPPVKEGKYPERPIPAATGPLYDLSLGYSTMSMPMPGAGHALLNGVDANGNIMLRPSLGLMLNGNYSRTSAFPGTPRGGFVVTLLTGPAFYPIERGDTRVFVRGLGGFGMVDGAVPLNQFDFRHGWLRRPAVAAGGGVERPLSGMFGIRVGADYIRTSFFGKTGTVQPQNNIRFTVSLLFPFHKRWNANYAQP